ncbi:hypothetical protein HAZT_HAZT009884 [Hyalella azteca]|uniref:TAFH domain-containing protein n=1 Tax=Hyalella azteca TaxID=294128 RepID=A0A6A0GRS5_HYAAZ|nr:hypothetical protein HAZT_HAZT009884 [Hyalella azteca]
MHLVRVNPTVGQGQGVGVTVNNAVSSNALPATSVHVTLNQLASSNNAGIVAAHPFRFQQSQQTISAESAKTKCKNFLATLLKLAGEQKQPVAKNVRSLIQGLIDSKVEPEAFTEELQKDLNSSPQPCLVPFLKKTLPFLRASLARGEITIEGVNPPPPSSIPVQPGATTVIPTAPVLRAPIVQQQQPQPQQQQIRLTKTAVVNNVVGIRPPVNTMVVQQSLHPVVNATTAPTTILQANSNSATHNGTPATAPSPLPPSSVNSSRSVVSVQASKNNKDRFKEKQQHQSYAFNAADDDINDVAAMGGVNLGEESQRILDSTGFVGTQIRSCKDEVFLLQQPLAQRLKQICK